MRNEQAGISGRERRKHRLELSLWSGPSEGRSVNKVPLNTPENTTILSSVRLNGEASYTIYNGGTTHEKFLDYLKNVLIPTLHTGDIVIMNNMRNIPEVVSLLIRLA